MNRPRVINGTPVGTDSPAHQFHITFLVLNLTVKQFPISFCGATTIRKHQKLSGRGKTALTMASVSPQISGHRPTMLRFASRCHRFSGIVSQTMLHGELVMGKQTRFNLSGSFKEALKHSCIHVTS